MNTEDIIVYIEGELELVRSKEDDNSLIAAYNSGAINAFENIKNFILK